MSLPFCVDLTGKVALVTGASRGLGAAIAASLSAAGAKVVLTSRSETALRYEAGRIRANGGKADAEPWDVSGEGASGLVDAVVRHQGRLDILVHAAGNQIRKPTLEWALSDWDEIFAVHLRAAFVLAQEAIRHMTALGDGGSIIFVGSMTSHRLGHPSTVGYNAAKAGLLGLARTLAVEFATSKIRVNTILPGFIETDMTAEVAQVFERESLVSRTPVGRYGRPAEVGGLAVFLCSDLASYMTGVAVTVDGGWSAA